jgi:hypothetical protein
MLGDSSGDMGNDDDDDDFFGSAIDEDDEDKKIHRQMLYNLGGVGFFALMGFAAKKVLNFFGNTVEDTNDVDGGMDITNVADQAANVNDLASAVAGDGGSTYNSAAAAAVQNATAMQASDSASQSPMSMTGEARMNPGGSAGQAASGNAMSAAQTQVMRTMAVNAASNAASSAASAASGLASAASAAAAAAAGTAAATTNAALSTIAAVVRSSLYDEMFGASALVFGSLAHLSLSFVTM